MKRSKVKPQYDLSSSDNMHSEREQHKDEVTLQLDLHTSSDNKLRNRMKVQHCDKHLSPYTIEASTRKKNTIKILKIDDSISSNPFRLWAHKCASLIPKLDFYRIEEDDSLNDGYKFTLKFPNEKGICNIDAARGKFISVDTLLFDFEKPRKWCFAEKIEVTLTKDGCQNACNLLWNDDTIGVWVPNEPHTPHHYFNSEETIEPPFRTGFYQSHEGSTRHSFEVLVRDEDENTVGTLEVGCISKGCDFRLEDGSFVYMAWYEKSWEYTFHEGSRKIMQHFIMNKDGSISPERAPWLVIAETAEGDLTLHNPSKIADKNDKTTALLVNHASDVYLEFVENDTRVQITPKIAPNLSTSWDKDGDEKWNLQPYEKFNRPTIVNVKVGLYSLTDLDTKSKTARIDLGVWCYWFDPRMASRFRGQNENSHVVPPGLWAPYFSLSESLGSNEMSIEVEEFEEVCQKFPGAAPGKMYTFTRYRGIIRNVMELQAFPYDFDPLEMTLFAQNNITFSNRKPERLSTKIDWRPLVMVESNFCIPQEADDFEVTATSLKYVSTRRQDGIQFVVHLSRFGQRKILNIILPLGLITVLDLYAFLVIDAELQARLMHHTTLFLAVVALLYVVRGQMPEKNRNTSVDTAIQGTMVLLVTTPIYGILEEYEWLHFDQHGSIIVFLIFAGSYTLILTAVFVRLARKRNAHNELLRVKIAKWKNVTKTEDMFMDDTLWLSGNADNKNQNAKKTSKQLSIENLWKSRNNYEGIVGVPREFENYYQGILNSPRSFLVPSYMLGKKQEKSSRMNLSSPSTYM